MHWLEQGWKFALRIQVGARRNADGAGASRTKVTQNVTKQIAGHHHIKEVRSLHKVGGQDVDMELVDSDLRVVQRHLGDALVPIRHGDGNAIGLGGTGQMLLRPRLRQLKGEFQDPVHTDARHHGFLHHDLTLGAGVHAPTNAGVLALGVLAHDKHVDLARRTPAAIAPHHRCNDARHQPRRAQVDILVKVAAKQQQRAPQRDVIQNFFRPADGTEVDGVMAANQVFPVVRQHLAVFLEIVPAGKVEVVKLKVNPVLDGRTLHNPNALGHDLFADTVTGNHCNSLFAHRESLCIMVKKLILCLALQSERSSV